VVAAAGARAAYFGAAQGWRQTRILDRADLAAPCPGPCIIEEYDSTCVVPPGAEARLDRLGNIAITVPRA
jgi:N-methylhydantoinase A